MPFQLRHVTMNMLLKIHILYAGQCPPRLVPQLESLHWYRVWIHTKSGRHWKIDPTYLLIYSDLCCYKVEFILTIIFFFKDCLQLSKNFQYLQLSRVKTWWEKSLLFYTRKHKNKVPKLFFPPSCSYHPVIYYKLHIWLLYKYTYPVLLASGFYMCYQTVPTYFFLRMHCFRLFMTDTSKTTEHTNIQTITNLKLLKWLVLGSTFFLFFSLSCTFTTKIIYC